MHHVRVNKRTLPTNRTRNLWTTNSSAPNSVEVSIQWCLQIPWPIVACAHSSHHRAVGEPSPNTVTSSRARMVAANGAGSFGKSRGPVCSNWTELSWRPPILWLLWRLTCPFHVIHTSSLCTSTTISTCTASPNKCTTKPAFRLYRMLLIAKVLCHCVEIGNFHYFQIKLKWPELWSLTRAITVWFDSPYRMVYFCRRNAMQLPPI